MPLYCKIKSAWTISIWERTPPGIFEWKRTEYSNFVEEIDLFSVDK